MTTDAVEAPQGQSTDILFLLQKRMEVVKQENPEWFAAYEDNDPFTASSSVTRELIERAPTDFALGVLVGIYMLRQQISIVTERPFE